MRPVVSYFSLALSSKRARPVVSRSVLKLKLLVAELLSFVSSPTLLKKFQVISKFECFNDWGGRGYDDSVPGGGTKTTPSGDRTT